MKTAFGTVIYQEALPYAGEYIASLNAQTDQDFDLLLVNDNLSREQAKELAASFRGRTVLVHSSRHSIHETRVCLLKEAARGGYELLIMGDFDDTFADTRVAELRRAAMADSLKRMFYYHPLTGTDGKPAFKTLPERTKGLLSILESNYLGLGNSAVRAVCLPEKLLDSLSLGATPIFDWYFYSRLLIAGFEGLLVPDATTFYRLHEANLAGKMTVSREALERELRIKQEHYHLLAEDSELCAIKEKQYRDIRDRYLASGRICLTRERNRYWWEFILAAENMEEDDV